MRVSLLNLYCIVFVIQLCILALPLFIEVNKFLINLNSGVRDERILRQFPEAFQAGGMRSSVLYLFCIIQFFVLKKCDFSAVL